MKHGRFFSWAFLMFLTVVLLVSFQNAFTQESAEELYEAAMFKKESEGDLNGAIQILMRIVREFQGDKKIAGKAQLQIGMCYEKLGKEEAIKAYELVLKNFTDQPELVAAARSRLAALQMAEPIGPVIEKLPKVMEVPAFSPDGTKISGIDWSVPGQNISVYDYTTGKQTAITSFKWTGEDWGMTYFPCFSPDGKEVAYWCAGNSGSELRVSTLDGKSRTLYRRSEKGTIIPCDWLPDGSAIVVLKQEGAKSLTLGLVPAQGGDLKALRRLDHGRDHATHPSVSPDGRFIAFAEGPPGKHDIKVMTVNGEFVGNLTVHPAYDGEVCWSPDGKHIAFISNRHGGRALWGMEVKGGKPAGKPFMISSEMGNTGLLKWTSKGLACEMFVMTWDIFLMAVDPKTGEPLDEARMLGYTPTGNNCCPRWSPDGKYLAFASQKKDSLNRGYIVVISPEKEEAKEYPIPTDNYRGFLTDLSWVPDGSGLGFTMFVPNKSDGGQERILFRLNLETAKWETWPIPTRFGGTWGPDGTSFVFVKIDERDKNVGIAQWNPYTGEERIIYRVPQDVKPRIVTGGIKFSQDAKKLVFTLNSNFLFVLDLETGEVKSLGSDLRSATWSPNGELLLALNNREDGWPTTMSVLPTEGGERTEIKLGDKLPKDYHLMQPHWSPDGKQIVFGTRYSIHEALLLKNVIPKK
ncbi:MAG: PD40 domain-containing protein [Candidatus Aminicenantes bacterium]|nr:MAG: PD40 domain-containing protein [Candidatus Aminicenantes bacterium]